MGKRLTLLLGGARSGKSAFAQKMAEERGRKVLFVATATAGDDEMAARIAAHQTARPTHWRTLEASTRIGLAIQKEASGYDVVLIDCLTLWAANILTALEGTTDPDAEKTLGKEIEEFLAAYTAGEAEWILVSNEVGMGLVPPNPLGRSYRDALGRLNQKIAGCADEVLLLVAGLPLVLKQSLQPHCA
jgi:adenosylcobinamide kinase / adenosylcobinamide-phosphate guanylyltransferase